MKATKKVLPVVATALAALATSCSSDALGTEGEKSSGNGEMKTVSLTASTGGGSSTRVGMDNEERKVSFYWQKGDAIYVQTKNGSNYSGAKFSTEAETGSTTATFNGQISENAELGGYAVSPYNENHRFTSETSLTYHLPDSYSDYTVTSTDFEENSANDTHIPLLGKVADGKATFTHLGGLAVITVDQMPAATGTLTVTASQQLAGNFTVDLSAETPTLAAQTSTTGNTVTFTYQGATANSTGVFFLPLAAGSYSNVTITLNGKTVKYGNLYVPRASVNGIKLYRYNDGYEKFAIVNGTSYTSDYYTFVDLGLPSGLLWATANVNDGNGEYFAWGEIASRTNVGEANYKFTKTPATLEAEDDAATRIIGNGMRMPSKADFEELMDENNCTWEVVNLNGANRFESYKVTSKKNGNSINFATGGIYYSSPLGLHGKNHHCYFWSSTLNEGSTPYGRYAWCMRLQLKVVDFWDYCHRYYLMNIRAVSDHATSASNK